MASLVFIDYMTLQFDLFHRCFKKISGKNAKASVFLIDIWKNKNVEYLQYKRIKTQFLTSIILAANHEENCREHPIYLLFRLYSKLSRNSRWKLSVVNRKNILVVPTIFFIFRIQDNVRNKD